MQKLSSGVVNMVFVFSRPANCHSCFWLQLLKSCTAHLCIFMIQMFGESFLCYFHLELLEIRFMFRLRQMLPLTNSMTVDIVVPCKTCYMEIYIGQQPRHLGNSYPFLRLALDNCAKVVKIVIVESIGS